MELVVQPLQRTINVRAGANLLEVLREHDVPLSYSCMSGSCGTCRCKVLEGEVFDVGRESKGPLVGGDKYVLACQTVLTGPCTIQIPELDEVIVHPARIIKATVTAIEDATHDIKLLRLRPAKAIEFSPGQYVRLEFTPEHSRPYSMAGLCSDGDLEFHIRLVEGGRVTGYIANTLRVGDSVRVRGPLGTAYLRRKHAGPMLCVGGGTGLAPILSIVKGAIEAGMSNPIHLYFGVRSPRDIYGTDRLESLQAVCKNLHVHVVVTSDAASHQRSGLVTEAVDADWKTLDGWRAYLCGAPPMVEATTLLVNRKGILSEHIYADAFYSSGT